MILELTQKEIKHIKRLAKRDSIEMPKETLNHDLDISILKKLEAKKNDV